MQGIMIYIKNDMNVKKNSFILKPHLKLDVSLFLKNQISIKTFFLDFFWRFEYLQYAFH